MDRYLTINSESKSKHFFIFWLVLFLLSCSFYIKPILPIIVIFGIVGFILFYFFFIKYPFIWICFMIIGTGLGDYGAIGGGITIFHISWFLGIVSITFQYLYIHTKKITIYSPINIYIFLYLGVSAISLIYSPNTESGVLYLAVTFALFIFYLLIINLLREKKHYKFLVYSIIISNIIIALFTFYQIFFQNVLFFGRQAVESSTGDKIWRASGTYNDPNVTASFLFVGIILTVAVVFYSKEKFFSKTLIVLGTLIPIAGIIATFSRSGWISLVVGLFTLLFFQKSKIKILYSLVFFVCLFLILIILTPYGEFITARFVSIFDIMKDPSIHVRLQLGLSGLDMFLQDPIFGLGYRSFPIYYDYFRQSQIPQIALNVKESHTLFITLLAETGIIGLTVVFLWFRRFFIDNFKLIKQVNDHFLRSIVIGCFSVFVSLNICFLFYGNLFPHFNLLWLIFGLVYSIKSNNDNEMNLIQAASN